MATPDYFVQNKWPVTILHRVLNNASEPEGEYRSRIWGAVIAKARIDVALPTGRHWESTRRGTSLGGTTNDKKRHTWCQPRLVRPGTAPHDPRAHHGYFRGRTLMIHTR
jgi:hypothetical protein